MLYFADLKDAKVYTEDQILVGYLRDFLFRASAKPSVTKLVIENTKKETLIVECDFLEKLSPLTLSKKYELTEATEAEVSIIKNVLDKQIIDIKGNKIVRVNDVAFQEKPQLMIAGVDIGLVGVLRWFNLEDRISNLASRFHFTISSAFLSWADIQPLEISRGKVVLKTVEEKLEKMRPEDLADHLEKTTILNARKILNNLEESYAAEVIGNLNINYQNDIFKHLHLPTAAKILELIDPDEAVDILLTLSPLKRRQIVALLHDDFKTEIEYLLSVSKTSIGEILTTEYLIVPSDKTAFDVIEMIRKETADFSAIHYVYVHNRIDELTGVFSLHELLLQMPQTPVYKFMSNDVIVVHVTTPKEIAIKKMVKYKLVSIPVINDKKRMVGLVTIDDISESLLEQN